MVRGRGIAVTAVALMYQCALTTRIARGRGAARPNARQAAVYRLTSSAFIGLPCPKNAAGIVSDALSMLMSLLPADGGPSVTNPAASQDRVETSGCGSIQPLRCV